MIPVKEEGEKMVLPVEEREMEEEEEAEEEEEKGAEESGGEGDSGSEEDERDEEPEDISDDKKDKKEEDTPQAVDETKEDIPLPGQPKEKKPPESLNVNNEVVKMRKEVKRVKALIIRKMTRQIGKLRKKKGKEAEIEKNQRRAARLLEEIHAMKVLSPDVVTKRALQKNLNFEQECKNPNSSISDRAIARIATHPQFKKKIEDIKAAVKAFKEERVRGGKEVGKEKMQNKAGKVVVQSPDKKRENKSQHSQKDIVVEEKKTMDTEEEDSVLKGTANAALSEPEKESQKMIQSNDETVKKESPVMKMVRPALVKSSEVKDIVRNEPKMKAAEEKHILKAVSKEPEIKKDEESDLDSSDDEEKEYFDDSTEERFHKQSSHSEESDEGDDFFVGKVSKFKKRKQKGTETERRKDVKNQTDVFQSKREDLESKTKSKGTSLDSVFCSSLAGSKPGGGRGAGRGRGGDRFRGQGKSRGGGGGPKGDFSKQSKFQKQEKGLEREPGSQYMKSVSSEKTFPVDSRGKGRGRGGAMRKNDPRDGGVFSLKPPQPALHPSWEASKKRKEQQGQILAFQGKKIKFDDDD